MGFGVGGSLTPSSLPGLISSGATPELVRTYFEAAAAFFRRRIWPMVPERQAFRIHVDKQVTIPGGTVVKPGTVWACALGYETDRTDEPVEAGAAAGDSATPDAGEARRRRGVRGG